MVHTRIRRVVLIACLLAVALPAGVSAQSAIAGLVTDNTGGVLPGVTVDAASPALIEGSRIAVTDGQGRYSIVDLRPGLYSVTFTLPGFSIVKRDGLQLPADFTATVNVELSVGSLEETVTVSGESPVVDVQNTARTQVMTRDVIDSVPNSRSWSSIGSLTPGIKMDKPNVGGAEFAQNALLSARGAAPSQTAIEIDGMSINVNSPGNNLMSYPDNNLIAEATYQTSGITAETSRGGLRINMIPKEGGNTFSGLAFAGGTLSSWVSNNVSPEMQQRGLDVGESVKYIHDLSFSPGGPIKRDKLWFFTSVRWLHTDQLTANTVQDNGKQGVSDDSIKNVLGRLTWQATPRNKIAVWYMQDWKWRGHTLAAFVDPEEAASNYHTLNMYNSQAKWTSAVSSRLLVEAGISVSPTAWGGFNQPGRTVPRPAEVRTCLATPCFWEPGYDQSTPWHRMAAKRDLDLGTRWNATGLNTQTYTARDIVSGSLSYVTGSHAFKTGAEWEFGPYEAYRQDNNGSLQQQYRNGVPTSVLVFNAPNWAPGPYINADLGVYAQDTWTIDRLTANLGVRLEWFKSSLRDQVAPAGRFAAYREFPAVSDLPNWFNVVPRLGASYDVFGTGKTALKFTFGKYMTSEATGFASRYNSMVNASDTRTWTDRDRLGRDLPTNGDDLAQDNEIGPSNNRLFGIRSERNPDPDIKRGYNLLYSAGIDHEVLPGVSMTFMWYGRGFRDLETQDNLLRSLSDWTPVTVYDPINGTPITAYNLDVTKRGLINVVDKTSTDYDLRGTTYTGFEVSGSVRLPRRGVMFGGWTTERTVNVTCDSVDDPNTFRFCNQAGRDQESGVEIDIPFLHEFKFGATYPLPWRGIEANAAFVSFPARESRVDWRITPGTRYAANCPGACTRGAIVMPNMTEPALVLQLTPPGTRYLDRWNQLDLGARKNFRFGSRTISAGVTVYNVLNNAALFEEIIQFGPRLGTPIDIMVPRLVRAETHISW